MNIIYCFPTGDQIAQHWGEISPFVDMAVQQSNGELNLEHILAQIIDGFIKVITVFDSDDGGRLIAVITIEKTTFPSGKRIMNIQCAGGSDLDIWFHEVDEIISEIARREECTALYITGRAGWVRKLKGIGYKPIHTVICKEI